MKRKISLLVFNYVYLILLVIPFATIYHEYYGCEWNYGMFYHAPIISTVFITFDLAALTFNLLVLTNVIFKNSLSKEYESGNKLSFILCVIFFIITILLFNLTILFSLGPNAAPGC